MLLRASFCTELRRHVRASALIWAGIGVLSSIDGRAAEPGHPADVGRIEEIVVTATRQGQQSIQTVPMSISVISAKELDAKGLAGLSDIGNTLPSVNMQSQSPGVNSIEMRGLVTTSPDITTLEDRSLTSVYLDDVPISVQTANPDLKVFDLERVEVIKGPQGTLYGAGSMAGTIRLISKKPDSHEMSGSADASVSETKHGGTNYSIRGSINLPIKEDVLAVRLNGYRGEDSGYIDNIQRGVRDANNVLTTQGRVALRFTPTDKLTIDTSAIVAILDTHGNNVTYTDLGAYQTESAAPEGFEDDFKLYNITLDDDLNFAHLVGSVSYLDRNFTDYRSFQFFEQSVFTGDKQFANTSIQANTIRDATQELRLVSNPDSKIRWTVGAFHEWYHRNYLQVFDDPGFDAWVAENFGPGLQSVQDYGTPQADESFYGVIDVIERQTALFGEATYEVLPKLDLTVGARYFDFKQNFNLFFNGFTGAIAPGDPVTRNGVEKASGVNPRIVAAYHLTDSVMLYSQAARGFRYGGVNIPAPAPFCGADLAAAGYKESPPTFGPDHLWNFEVGEKGQFFDNRFRLNVTGFHIDWDDVQTTHPLACGYPFVQNSGKVVSQGLELESKLKVGTALTLSLDGSYTHAVTDGPIPNLDAVDGSRVPFFPKTIVTAGAEYSTPVGDADLRWSADWTYRSNAFTDFNPSSIFYREIPSSTLLNASITYARSRYEVALYGTNLTNNLLISTYGFLKSEFSYQPGDQVYIGRPRTIGVRLHVGF